MNLLAKISDREIETAEELAKIGRGEVAGKTVLPEHDEAFDHVEWLQAETDEMAELRTALYPVVDVGGEVSYE